MDLLNRVIIPSFLMIIASVLLSISVIKLRKEFSEQINRFQENGHENGHREIRLAVTSITLNIIYITLTLPLPVALLFGNTISDFFLFLNFYLFCFSYSINFYILLAMNSLFRSEFFLIFRNIFNKKHITHPDVFELE